MTEINFNIASSVATSKIVANNRPQEIEIKQFLQGPGIDPASDDASGHQMMQRMKIEISGLEKSTGKVNDAISILETIDGSSQAIIFALERMQGLATRAATETASVTERAALDLEFGELFAEIQSLATESNWHNTSVMSSSDQETGVYLDTTVPIDRSSVSVGKADHNETISITLKSWDPRAAIRGNAIQQTVDPVTGLQLIGGNQFTPNGLLDGGDDLPLGDPNMLGYDLSGNDDSITGGLANQFARVTETQAFGSAVLWVGNPLPGDGIPQRLNILSKINAEYVLANIEKAISAASDERARLNEFISQLDGMGDYFADVSGELNQSQGPIIGDVGYAVEASEVSRSKIIAKAGAGLSAQASAGNQTVLTFLMK